MLQPSVHCAQLDVQCAVWSLPRLMCSVQYLQCRVWSVTQVDVHCVVFAVCGVDYLQCRVWSATQVDVQYESGQCQSSCHRDGVKVCPSLSNIRVGCSTVDWDGIPMCIYGHLSV